MEIINIADKSSLIKGHWNPKILARLNGQEVKLVKLKGPFVWHKHDLEDELFLVIKGSFTMEFRDRKVFVSEQEMILVPKGVEHRPVAETEATVLLFEPAGTFNTGDQQNELTRRSPEKI